jgi:DNA-binding NarL/FixJ family response regulator
MIALILPCPRSAIIPPMIRVLIVDDHPFFRKTLREFLEALDLAEVIGEASDGKDALAAAARLSPQVIIMDVQMPGLDGISACAVLKQKVPALRVILYSMDDPRIFAGPSREHAYACLSKDRLFDELPSIIGRVSQALGTA